MKKVEAKIRIKKIVRSIIKYYRNSMNVLRPFMYHIVAGTIVLGVTNLTIPGQTIKDKGRELLSWNVS